MTKLLTLLVSVGNLIFAARAYDVIRRSQTSIPTAQPTSGMPSLSIIVPARDEERQIERCVYSLLATRHPDFEVIVIDDESTDGTRSLVERIAANDSRLQAIAGAPLPVGWVGKNWALAQGAASARGDWLLVTDADAVHEPLAAASALAWAIAGGYDVVSLLTDQETAGCAERLFLPSILFTIMLGIGAVDDVNDPRKPDTAIFNGQYVLASRKAYEGIGGHAAVRGEIAEDLQLARLFKRDGRFRTFLAASDALVRTRMYRSFGEIWHGFVKNFAVGARDNEVKAAGGIALLSSVAVSPLLCGLLVRKRAWLGAAAIATTLGAVVAIAESGMRGMRFRRGSGLALPLGLGLTVAIFATSLVGTRGRRGVSWRGRRYGGF